MSYSYNPLKAANHQSQLPMLQMISGMSGGTSASSLHKHLQMAVDNNAGSHRSDGKPIGDYHKSPVVASSASSNGAGPMDLETGAESLVAADTKPVPPPVRPPSAAIRPHAPLLAHHHQHPHAMLYNANGMLGPSGGLMMMPRGPPLAMFEHAPDMMHHHHHAYTATMLAAANMQQIGQQQQPPNAPAPFMLDVHSVPPPLSSGASASASVLAPIKEQITFKSCVMVPPNVGQPAPTVRERPLGCRTVFVGGLPENVTDEQIREVFERCGEIATLRLSKKNFCHIRFLDEASVDAAIYFSGYRLRLGTGTAVEQPAVGGQTEPSNGGRLHVDYAQARDDQHEWECRQRQQQREQRHRERCDDSVSSCGELHRRVSMSSSPPPIVHYTDLEAGALADQLKQTDLFDRAIRVLLVWLERGDCNKKNATTFYTMIQSVNANYRRLQTEQAAFEEELQRARDLFRRQTQGMTGQFNQIEKVFGAASHKKVWDHFSKAQRKNIDLWKKQAMDIRSNAYDNAILVESDEMDMSDDEPQRAPRSAKRTKFAHTMPSSSGEQARRNSTGPATVQQHRDESPDAKDQQLKVLHETIRNLQKQLLENSAREKENGTLIADLENRLKQANVKTLLLKTKMRSQSAASSAAAAAAAPIDCHDPRKNASEQRPKHREDADQNAPSIGGSAAASQDVRIAADEARIIGLVSTFLVVHPFGASLDYVFSYVQRAAPHLRPKQLEEILVRYGSTFSEEVTGIGAQIERKWKFCGFDIEQ